MKAIVRSGVIAAAAVLLSVGTAYADPTPVPNGQVTISAGVSGSTVFYDSNGVVTNNINAVASIDFTNQSLYVTGEGASPNIYSNTQGDGIYLGPYVFSLTGGQFRLVDNGPFVPGSNPLVAGYGLSEIGEFDGSQVIDYGVQGGGTSFNRLIAINGTVSGGSDDPANTVLSATLDITILSQTTPGQSTPSLGFVIGFATPQNAVAVPEPASIALLGAGLIGLGLVGRRKKS